MTTIAILPAASSGPQKQRYEAVSGTRHAVGASVGAALDALNRKLGKARPASLVVVQPMKGDAFFSGRQIARMRQLMDAWRRCRDEGTTLDGKSEAQLKKLVSTELAATIKRCEAMGVAGQ